MIVSVTTSGAHFTDMDNLTRFHIDANGLREPEFEAQLAAAPALTRDAECGAVWVAVDTLRAAVPEAHRAEFEKMLEYASSNGWVTEDGAQVRGHVENLSE